MIERTLKQLCYEEKETIKLSNFSSINYLETGDITQNRISSYSHLKVDVDKIPSRARKIAKKGQIVFSLVRPNQKHYGIVDENWPESLVVSTGFAVIQSNEDIDPYYLYYLLTQEKNINTLQTIAEQSVTSYPSIVFADIENLKVRIYQDFNVQKKIASLLKSIDQKITTNEKINDNLSQQIKQIFDYWFKQYNFPNIEEKAYSLSNGKFKYNNTIKRDIPEKWTVGSLINNPLAEVIQPGVDYFDTKNYLATKNINGTTISDGDYVTYESRESRANMQPSINSVWFAKMKNSVKHLFISNSGQPIVDKYILSTGFEGLKCNTNSFAYISGIISDPTFEITKNKYSHGATQQSVNNDDLDLYKIVIPDAETLEKYSQLVNPMYEKINALMIQNNKLTKIRDTLLPLLLNGQVTIR